MPPKLLSTVRNLSHRKGRRRRKLAVLEGTRLVEEALQSGLQFRGVLVREDVSSNRVGGLLEELSRYAVPVDYLAPNVFDKAAATESPQGVIAVVEHPSWTLAAVEPKRSAPVLVLDAVQDPGNVGTLVRTAYSLGAVGVLLLDGTADLLNPKVLRAAMGATFKIPIVSLGMGELKTFVEGKDVTVWVGAPLGTNVRRLNPPERLALVMGNETAGTRPQVDALAESRVSIPLARGAESLNVAVAAGILLFEVGVGAR